MIRCALSKTTVEKLYKSIYKHMTYKASFNPQDYMAYVFGNKANSSTPETAAKIVQHIPRMIIDIYNTEFLGDPEFTLDLNAIAGLGKKYLNEDTGISSIISDYTDLSKKFLRALNTTQELEAGNTPQVDPVANFQYDDAFRLKPYSSLTGTSQELIAVDPTSPDFSIETIDQSKRAIYSTLEKMKAVSGEPQSPLADFVYQDRVIKLKPTPLLEVDESELDDYIKNVIVRSKSIQKAGKAPKGVTQVQDQILLVLSDEQGNNLYFDEEGNITTKEAGGKLVYQFMRDAKKVGDNYSVSNIYGYSSILDPVEIAMSLYKTTDPSVIDNIEKMQQEEFKMLYDFKNQVLNTTDRPLLTISGISTGVFEKFVGKKITLSQLSQLANIDRSVFKSIKTVQKDRGSFKAGNAVITINNAELIIDRADVPLDIARQVADVLTNKDIEFSVRLDFYKQFFTNKIDYRARRHLTSGDASKGELFFNYSNKTFQESKTRKFLENTLDLSQKNLESMSETELKDMADKIYEVFAKGKGKDGNFFPTKMMFNSELLKDERYMVYNTNTKTIGFGNYIDLLKTLPADINLASANKDVVNTYIHFNLPNATMSLVAQAQRDVKEDQRTPVKQLKDSIVDKIKSEGPQVVEVSDPKKGFYMGKHYANFKVKVDGIDELAKVYFPNKSVMVAKDGKFYQDPTWPSAGQQILLTVREQLSVDGIVYTDVVEAFTLDEATGNPKDYIGVVAERDISEYREPAVPEEAEEIESEVEEMLATVVIPVIDNITEKDTVINADNPNTEVADLFSKKWVGLDRSAKLSGKVTAGEIQDATKWWSTHPLNKNIKLEHLANVVNSNAFAKFVTSGQTLFSRLFSKEYGKIQIYSKGSMVDVYHEAWHAFSQLYLTKDEKTKLYNEVRNYKTPNGKQPHKNKSFKEIEELLAEDFRSYAKNPTKYKTKEFRTRKNIFQRIIEFLTYLFTGKLSKSPGFNVKTETVPVVNNNYPKFVSMIYNKLYFADKSGLFNNLQPSYKNIMWDMLNRGVENVENPKNDSLNRQDSMLISESIDSIISESIDRMNNKIGIKSATLRMLNIDENRVMLYDVVNKTFQQRLNQIKEQLANEGVDYDTYIAQELEEREPITYEQEQMLNNVRILQTALDNWGDDKTGVVRFHKDNSRFDIIREDYNEVDVDQDEVDENGDIVDNLSGEQGPTESDIKADNVGKKSLEQLAQKEALYITKSLFKITNGKTVNNALGFKQLADFPKMWKILMREIGGIKDPEQMYTKLVEAAESYVPEFKQLVYDKLQAPSNIQREAEFDSLASFWQTFSRPRIAYLQLTAFLEKEYDQFEGVEVISGITTEVLDASIDASNVVRKFVAEFKAQSPKDNPYITKVDNITALTNLDKLVKDFADPRNATELNVNKAFEFANAIGIYLDDIKALKTELKDNIEYYGLQYLYTMVKDFANIQAKGTSAPQKALDLLARFTSNPLNVFQMKIPGNLLPSLKVDTVYQKSAIKRLAELQGRFGYDTSNYSVLNPEGNLVNEFTDDSSISRKVDGINRAQNIKDLWANKDNRENQLRYMSYLDPAINSFVNKNRLQILNSIFATEGDGSRRADRNLKLVHVAGTQVADPTVDVGSTTTSLDIYSKFLQEMHTMLKGGIQEFIRAASKKDALGMKVEGGIIGGIGKGKDGSLYVDVDQFSPNGNGETYAATQVILPYIAGELDRIIKFKNNRDKFKNYVGYNLEVGKDSEGKTIYAGETFTAFDNVLTEDTKNILLAPEFLENLSKNGLSLEEFLVTDKSNLKQKIVDDVTNYFKQQTSENLGYLSAINFIDPALYDKISDKTLDKAMMNHILVKAFTYNSWIHNFETVILNYGDMAVYNHIKEELHKRNPGGQSGGNKYMTDINAQNFINNVWNADSTDSNGVVTRRTYGSVLAARKNNNEYKSFIYDGTFNTAITQDIERESVYVDEIEAGLRDQYTKEGKSKSEIDKIIAKELKPYKEMNEADGAGYITIDAYRTLKKLENAWSNAQENLYQKVIKGGKISAAEIMNFFPVYKLQNYGELANTELPLTAMHKFALMPLIPSELGNSQLDHLHAEMLRNNIQYLTFKSGSKAGSLTSNGKPDVIFADDTNTKLKDEITFTKNTIYLEYLKNVTNVNSKYKTTITFPTQLRGLILDGMFNQGIISEKEYEKLSDEYHRLVNDYTEILKLELLDEIGYEEKDGKYVGDMSKFLGMVQKELGKRDMPEHLLERIGVNTDGSIKTDLSLHLEADTIEKMLLAVLTKRLIRQKVKGEALVQVPSTMYNGLWDGYVKFDKADNEDVKKYLGSNNLPFYKRDEKGTKAMKIAISLQGDFINLLNLKDKDGNTIGTIDKLNELIKDDAWLNTGDNRKAITLAGARIPIQNLNSMEFAEVWHFLDPAAGNKVVVPTEIVAKAGSDFDVDKIFWMMPHIDTQGKYVTGALTNAQVKEQLNKIKNAKVKPGMKKPSTKAFIQRQKKAIENQLLNSTRDILSTPANYASLVRPNETYLVKGIADELEPNVIEYNRFKNMHNEGEKTFTDKQGKSKRIISPTRTLEIGYNLHKHDVNMVVKDVLGISALQNKKHPIFKSIGAKMPATYKDSYYDQSTRKYVDRDRDFDMRLLLPHNTIESVKDGKKVKNISLSGNLNQAGTRISDLSSHIMNGELDVEKDAWVAYIQANLETISILNYLLEAGVPEKSAIYFVSQPLIREYAAKQKQIKSAYSFLADKQSTPFPFVKYKAASAIEGKIPYRIKADILEKINTTNFDSAMSKLKDNDKVSVLLQGAKAFQTDVLVKNLRANLANGKVKLGGIKEIVSNDGDQIYKKAFSLVTNAAYYDAAVEATKLPGVLNENGEFDEKMMLDAIQNPNDPKYTNLAVATFLHFLEIEKQIKGLEAVKRQSNPDTKLLKTVQQIRKREQMFLDSTETSKVDPQLPLDIRNKSILSSFYVNDMALDLIEPVLPLRLNKVSSDFITKVLNTHSSTIANKYGVGMEGEERFTSEFNNAVINYIFQNFMSNFVDSSGNIVEVPDIYRDMTVITKPNIKNGVEIVDDKIYVDVKTLNDQYKNQKYLKSSEATDSYSKIGLLGFSTEDNPFPTQAIYNKYVFEREYLRTLYPEQNEKFLNQRALLNTFNRDAIVGTEEYSYTDLLMSTIKEFSYLADQFPVLEQLSRLPFKGAEKIVQLNNKNLVKGDLAEVYYQNLKDLGDINVKKVQSPEENRRISEVFKLFSLMMIHQHGVGYSKYGFVKALDDSDYISVMDAASKVFLDKNLNEESLRNVFKKLISEDQFKNYVVSPREFNTGLKTLPVNETALELGTKVKEYVMTQGEEKFDQMMEQIAPELAIMDVPENLELDKVMNEEYDDYVPVTYKSLSAVINRLYKAGVNIDQLPFLFNDFATDEVMDASQFITLLDSNLETLVEEEPFLEETPSIESVPTQATTNNPAEYTNHSGGAIGSDTQWDVIGKEFGMVNNKHYYTGEKGPKNAPLGNVDITNDQIAVEGASKVAQAAKEMWGYKYNTMKDQRLIRNWAQVANSDAVFAIGKLGEEGDIWKGDEKSAEPRRLLKAAVQGGTGYAVEMAIQAGKPVYVFDLVNNVWMKYNPEGLIDTDIPGAKGRFEQIDTPVLTKNFAGIGTREINEAGKQAIRDVYANTFKATTQPTQTAGLLGSEKKINIYAGTGENAELSNFAERPVTLGGQTFRTPEGAFQAMKIWFTNAVLLGTPASKENLEILEKLKTATGSQAKALGREITDLSQATWDRDSSGVMKNILTLSFEQNPDALAKLLATGDATLTHTQDKTKWGTEFPRLLMEVRDELRTAQPEATVSQPTTSPIQETIPTLEEAPIMVMLPDNISKIESGQKTTTLRTDDFVDGIYRIGDNLYRITNRGLLSVEEAGGVELISRSEAFGPEGPRFPSTKDFLAGKRKLYVLDIQRVQEQGVEIEISDTEEYTEEVKPITEFYDSLTEAQREKLGNLANVIDTYDEMYADTMSVQEYIDNVLKCKI